jgi:hypothetical protein
MRRTAALWLAAAAPLVPASTVLALHFRDGPPARVTGGFDEDSCVACHADQPVNDAEGRLTLSGFPKRYAPGRTYEIELALSRPQLKAAGFELAVRDARARTQAGKLEIPAGSGERIGLSDERGVQFAHHLRPEQPMQQDASAAPEAAAARWALSWTAPDAGGPVVLHAAAVAGDGDDSELGDFVYTTEAASRPD